MLAGAAARGEMGSKGGGGPVRLSDVDTWELAGFQNKVISHFMLVAYQLVLKSCQFSGINIR